MKYICYKEFPMLYRSRPVKVGEKVTITEHSTYGFRIKEHFDWIISNKDLNKYFVEVSKVRHLKLSDITVMGKKQRRKLKNAMLMGNAKDLNILCNKFK